MFYGESLASFYAQLSVENCQFPSIAQAKEVPYLERTDFFNNVKKSIAEKSTETWLDLQISFGFYFVTFAFPLVLGILPPVGPQNPGAHVERT